MRPYVSLLLPLSTLILSQLQICFSAPGSFTVIHTVFGVFIFSWIEQSWTSWGESQLRGLRERKENGVVLHI